MAAAEPRGGSKIVSSRCQIQALEKEVVRLKQECARQQALVRATQRTIGLRPAGGKARRESRQGYGQADTQAAPRRAGAESGGGTAGHLGI